MATPPDVDPPDVDPLGASHREGRRRMCARRLRPSDFEELLQGAVDALGATLELRDAYTPRHQLRVAQLARAIAVELGADEDEANQLGLAGRLHDIGKNGVPTQMLMAARPLTGPEYEVVKAHVRAAYDVLLKVPFPGPVAIFVLHHHERLDGSGYPSGLRGEAISRGGRVLAVADTVEAMSSHRPYRPAPGLEAGLAKIEEFRGSRYDADVVDACVRLFRVRRFTFRDPLV